MSYTPYTPSIQMEDDVNNWGPIVSRNVNMAVIGFSSEAQQNPIGLLLHNAHETSTGMVKGYVNQHINRVSDWMNEAFDVNYATYEALTDEVKNLWQIVETQAELLHAYKTQLD